MEERMRFVARLLEGEKMAVLCREWDISRKTGYKIFQRYKASGTEAFSDRSRRPYRHANRVPFRLTVPGRRFVVVQPLPKNAGIHFRR
jgi:putative transposase